MSLFRVFFPTVKTKALNVLVFIPLGESEGINL